MPELQLKFRPPAKQCFYCGDMLAWHMSKHYVHSDGNAYVTVVEDDGVERDDHCVLAVEPGHEQRPRTGLRPGEKVLPREE